LRSHPEVGRQRGGAKNPKSPTISTTFPKIAGSRRGLNFPKLYIQNFSQNSSLGERPNIPQSPIQNLTQNTSFRERPKIPKALYHNLFLLSKI
jgi:hypothetical protein